MFKDAIKNCKDLASHVVQAVERKSHHYTGAYVVFDDYNVQSSLKHRTRNLRTGGKSVYMPHYKIEDGTRIKDFTKFLSSTQTKDRLTLYLAEKLVQSCTSPVSAVTHLGILSNKTEEVLIDPRSSQEEADTLLILCSAEIHKTGTNVHIYSSDTDILVLALAAIEQLGDETTLIMGTGANRRRIPLMPICHVLGQSHRRDTDRVSWT